MKTLNSTSLSLQKSNSIYFLDRIILLRQYEGIITDVVSSSQVKLQGDATSFFSDGDTVICPLKSITSQVIIDVPPTYNSGTDKTTIVFTIALFSSTDLGSNLCLPIDLFDKLVDGGIKKIKSNVEGTGLTDFDSGYMDVEVDNSDGYFLNKSETGIFNGSDVYWCLYYTKFRNSSDNEILYFGGLVDLTDFVPNFFNKTITIRTYGHSYELKRYPAYNIINENSDELSKIGGMKLVNYTESDDSEPGIKSVLYRPFANSKLKGVEVVGVSSDSESGIKILEFRYPNMFRWNNGSFTMVAELSDTDSSSGLLKIYEKDGSGDSGYAIVKFGSSSGLNEYPDLDDEIWVDVKNDLIANSNAKDISDQGRPTIQYDDGEIQHIKIHFPRILRYDESLDSMSEISAYTNTPIDNDEIEVLQANADELIIVSSERFWGAEFILSELFSAGVIDLKYSLGGTTWSASMTLGNNSLVDGTSGFTSQGKITWDEMPGWLTGDYVTGSTTNYKGYMIKITRTSATGTLKIAEIKRIIRLLGKDGDFFEVDFNQSLLLPIDIDDEVITKYQSGVWEFGGWYDNIPLQYLLVQSLEKSNYGATKRFITDMKITSVDYSLNIWGKPPKYNYIKNPTAISVDFSADYVYIAIGLEIWKCSFTGLWEYVGEPTFYGSGNSAYEYEIKRIWTDSSFVYVYVVREFNSKFQFSHLSKISKTTGEMTELAALTNYIYSGRYCSRDGTQMDSGGGNYIRMLGQHTSGNYGENICIPYPQEIWTNDYLAKTAVEIAPDLDSDATLYIEWWFTSAYNDAVAPGISGPVYKSKMCFMELGSGVTKGTATVLPMEFNWSFGQQGCEIIDKTSNTVYLFAREQDDDSNYRARMRNFDTGVLQRPVYYRVGDIPNCHCWNEGDDILYFGYTSWHDIGDDTECFSYITRYAKTGTRITSVSKVIHFNATGSVYTNVDALIEAGTHLISYPYNEIGDIIYIGHSKKFRNLEFDLNSKANDYIFEYWNGSSWTALANTVEADIPDEFITFQLPYDWAQTTVNSSSSLWFIRIRQSTAVSSDYVVAINLWEEIIWDSELSNSGNYPRYMPIWMCLDEEFGDVIHGCMFNRDTTGTNPFQWVYYSFDVNSNTCYFQNEGTNYTFDGTYLMKDFVYDTYNRCTHFIAENIRYQDKPAYMVKGTFNIFGSPIITLTKEITPRETEYGSQTVLECNQDDGTIFGLTKGYDKILWEYSKEFYPRIEQAKFSDSDSVQDIIKYIAQIMNCYYIIHASRYFRFITRELYNGTMNLEWNTNMVKSNIKPRYWQHKYDSVKVSFQNPYSELQTGEKKIGYDGWNREILSIGNPLIQNNHLAKYIAEINYDFFNQFRLEIINVDVVPLIQLENLDRFNISMPDKIVEIDSDTYFIITEIEMNSDKLITLKGLEIK